MASLFPVQTKRLRCRLKRDVLFCDVAISNADHGGIIYRMFWVENAQRSWIHDDAAVRCVRCLRDYVREEVFFMPQSILNSFNRFKIVTLE